jgi:hypothetical protein
MYQERALREQFLDADGILKDGASEAYQRSNIFYAISQLPDHVGYLDFSAYFHQML